MKSPCKDCRFRAAGCHAFCKSYLDYKTLTDKEREERNRLRVIKEAAIAKKNLLDKKCRRP